MAAMDPQRTVCIIENDPDTAGWMESVLRPAGFRTEIAHSAEEASDLLCRLDPDLILVNRHLPDESGTDLCARLTLSDRCARVPIVLMSDLPGKESLALKRDCRAVDLLLKPFSTRELLQGVFAWTGLPEPQTCPPCASCLES